jgi:uncharacterized protein
VLVSGPLDVGPDNFLYVFLPAGLALIPLAMDRLAAVLVAALLMLMFVFLEILTIGVYFLPAAGAMSVAALVSAPPSITKRRREVEELLQRFHGWARVHDDIRALAVVGSWARETPRHDSDLDLVVLTDIPDDYAEGSHWVRELGRFELVGTRARGRLTERRLRSPTGLEIDVGFAHTGWASVPLDAGTRRVVEDGLRPVYDPDGRLARLPKADVRSPKS